MQLMLLSSLVLIGVVSGNISGRILRRGQCLCISGNRVNVRGTACGGVIGSASKGQCFTYTGYKRRCTLNRRRYDFFQFNFGSRRGWAAGNFLVAASSSSCSTVTQNSCQSVRIYSRNDWGASNPRARTNLATPVSMMFIHHTAGAPCTYKSACVSKVKGIQNYHMNSRRWSDIGYNFLIGEDGNVYEGRGWNTIGAHASDWNSKSYGIAVIGNFSNRRPNSAALSAIDKLIQCGIQKGKIRSTAKIYGHRNGGCTSCPGDQLFNWVAAKRNYGGRLAGSCRN